MALHRMTTEHSKTLGEGNLRDKDVVGGDTEQDRGWSAERSLSI